jgi:ribonucleoside-diphosphate reductase alpha chain
MLRDQSTNKEPEGEENREDVLRDVVRVLESAGFSRESIADVAAQLRGEPFDSAQGRPGESAVANGNGKPIAVPHADGHGGLSENARVILEKRYLRRDEQGKLIETPEELFRRVARAIALGEPKEYRQHFEERFYDLLTSLDFLPNSPTIVNAGTGRGCLSACFHPEQPVLAEDGLRPISSLKIGDLVLTHTGSWMPVTEVMRRTSDHLLEIEVAKLPKGALRVTREHPILTLGGWKSAGALTKEDFVVIPYDQRVVERHVIEVDHELEGVVLHGGRVGVPNLVRQLEKGHASGTRPGRAYKVSVLSRQEHTLPSTLSVDADLLWFLGMYLAEGSISDGYDVRFTLSRQEKHLADRLLSYLQRLGVPVRLVEGFDRRRGRKWMTVRAHSMLLANLLEQWCGVGFNRKCLTEWIMLLPPRLQWHLLKGVDDGDGTATQSPVRRITLSNKKLVEQLFQIALRCGQAPSLRAAWMPAGASEQPWNLYFAHTQERYVRRRDGLVAYRVQAVREVPYDGEVWNLEVAGDHTYSANFVAVHNCFVVSPEDTMDSIMQVAYDAAMIEKWGGGIGFGLSKLRPRKDKISTTHGEACGPIAVMKLYSAVGATLTQGAFRLGAHMGQLRVTHPDIREFIHCKDNDDTLQNFNISVQITDEFMRAVQEDREWPLVNPRNNQVVSTVRAKDLWDEICKSAWMTGDPGVVFIDRVWETAPNPQMGLIETSNPCVTGDTLVSTGEGLLPIRELVGRALDIVVDPRLGNRPVQLATRVVMTGIKPVYRLRTREGYNLRLTADHRVLTQKGWVEAGRLQPGDKLLVQSVKGGFGKGGSLGLGRVLGWLVGDGHLTMNRACLNFYGEEKTELAPQFAVAVKELIGGTKYAHRDYTIGVVDIPAQNKATIMAVRLYRLAAEHGLVENKLQVPASVQRGCEDMQRGFLQALFTADGQVSGTLEKGVSVRLSSVSGKLLEDVQRLLLNFGIASVIYRDRRPAMRRLLPDGRGGTAEFDTQPYHDLVVSQDNLLRFRNEVGFLSDRKNQELTSRLARYSRGPYKERFAATFESLEHEGDEEVFDLTEPITHSFIANGLVVHNCGEEFLEDHGNCCLGSINLDRHISGNDIDWDKLGGTVRTAVRFLDDVIEVNMFPLPKLREVNLATRRIGLGVMGWADALVRLGVPYDSEQALELADKVGGFIKDVAWDESHKLAEERGPFPEYERSALKERGMPPVRNSSVITIAPTGTISRIAGCSSGIEPHFAIAWWSNVLWKDHSGNSERLLDAPASVWETLRDRLGSEDKVREVLTQVADHPEDAERILADHGVDAASYRTSMGISPEAHVRMQAIWQKHVTNSVSKTINLPNSATVEDVASAFWLAWETGCKAVTVYRDGSKAMQVLETGKDAKSPSVPLSQRGIKGDLTEDGEKDHEHLLVPRQRPSVVRGITERVRTGHGNMYVTVNFDDDGKPFEVFSTLGKAGGCHAANLEAISRLISLALRSGIDPSQVVEQLKGITCCPVWDSGVLVRSDPDALALVMSRHLLEASSEHTAHGKRDSAAQLALFPSSGGVANGHQSPSGARCPKCSGYLVHQEGCLKCLDCGYTKCE